MTYSWTQPQCASCFAAQNPGRQPLTALVGYKETCCTCGKDTRDGIYIRIDPKVAKFPTNLK